MVLLSYPYMTTGKTTALAIQTFEGKGMPLLFNTLSEWGRSPGEGNSYPLPIFWPGEFHGLYSPWDHKELDTTERISLSLFIRFVIAFLPRSKCLLISWLQSPYAVILEPKKRKSITDSTFSPSICHKVVGPYAMIFFFHYWDLSFFNTKFLQTPWTIACQALLFMVFSR